MTELARVEAPSGAVALNVAPAALVEWATAARAAHDLAEVITQTNFCPKPFRGKVGEATAAILAGSEVGLSPLAALNSFDDIQGTAAPKARTLLAIAQSQGHDIWLEKATDAEVVYKGQRRGSTRVQESCWTIARATQLGVTTKENWRKQPQTMLQARAASEIARLVAADALLGIPYSLEEIEDQELEPTRKVSRKRAEVVALPPAAAPRPVEDVHLPEPDEPPLDDESAAPPVEPETGEAVTKPQMDKMHARFNELGVTDRERRLEITRGLLDLPTLISAKELTKAQASSLIDVICDEGVSDESDLLAAAGLLGEPS